MLKYNWLTTPITKVFYSTLLLTIGVTSGPVYGQALEEIIVTAQRREQSLQEVPISIHAVTGPELTQAGFRTMEDLGQFSPSVEMNESLHEWSVTIRGMGNDVAAMAVEQSAPIFVDGIHFGRPSMIKGAFMDVERIEVLTGPQPVYFGQNATAGAFSIINRGPTENWEGDLNAEFGNFGRKSLEGAFGGPLTETIGVRVAAQWDQSTGHLRDIYTGKNFPNREDYGARIILKWNPTENFEGTLKVERMSRRSDGDTNAFCLANGPHAHDNFAVAVPGAIPEFTSDLAFEAPNCADGFGKFGVQEGTGSFPASIQGINNDDARSGLLDIREIAATLINGGGDPADVLKSREPMDATHIRASGLYELSNGISIEGTYGFVDYDRETFESSDESPFLMEAAFRNEDFTMHSGEVRVVSPSGGQIEWSGGIYYQAEELVMNPVNTVRAEIRQAMRIHDPYQSSEWKSVFANITFNFMDDRASLDVGGRYSDVHKTGGITARYRTWIMDIDPDPDGDGVVEATEHRPAANGGDRVRTDVGEAIISCETGLTVDGGTPDGDMLDRPVWRQQCGQYAGMAGFWTHEYRETDVPDPWDVQSPIDISPPLWGLDRTSGTANGPFFDTHDSSSFDPQVTLRYRPSENHTIYAKWARAFKAGGFDTSDRGISRGGLFFPDPRNFRVSEGRNDPDDFGPDGQKEFEYKKEKAEVYEIGSKGSFMDGRLRYAGTFFQQTIKDLQVETEIADITLLLAGEPPTGRFLTNAAKQRNRGFEFDIGFAATDRLTYNLVGVIQNSRMVEFIGGCTEFESLNAATTDCFTAAESIAEFGSDALEDNIDRSGAKAPRAPAWKFILSMDYEMPLFDRFVGRMNSKLAVSDEYTEDTLGFTDHIAWPVHADWNTLISFGPADESWDIGTYLRNPLGARQSYFPDRDFDQNGRYTDDMPASSFFTYGVQFNYHFR
jgi:outer membrane receptor protein involved in Fe transport